MDSLYRSKRIQDPIQVFSSLFGCSDRSDSILPVITRRVRKTSQETGSGKGAESRNSRFLLPDILVPTFNSKQKSRLVIDISYEICI